MDQPLRNLSWIAIFLVVCFCLACLTACDPGDERLQQTLAPIAQTAAADAAKLAKTGEIAAKTEAVKIIKTGQVIAKTKVESVKDTAVPDLATRVVGKLTPQPVATARPPTGDEVITYTVVKGDTLSRIAVKYALDLDHLIALNQDRYPSLKERPNYVEVGWVLIVATGSGKPLDPTPPPAPTKFYFPTTCDEENVYWAEQGFGCDEYRLDAVTEIGFSIGCVALWDDNPLGYFKTHTIYDGWVITRNGAMFGYGWFVDKEKKQTVIGPAIITKTTKWVECGIPGNP